ncbi:MAG: hypothetical protein ACE5GX_14820 [Thermoanaerobaculia bacterium]
MGRVARPVIATLPALVAGLAASVAVAATIGCAHLPAAGTVSAGTTELAATATGLLDEDLGTQHLMRMRYQGPKGTGALRLILQIEARERYRVEAKDRFGRSLWTLDASGGQTLLVDQRRGLYCRSEHGIRIPEIALESLPLAELPAILLGRLPSDLRPDPGDGYRDGSGRRWTIVGPQLAPDSWTIWQDGEPWLWWGRGPQGGGVLSHRTGSQLRWRQVVAEALARELAPPQLEARFREVSCDDWAGDAGG